MGAKIRAFVAVALPPSVRSALAELQRDLKPELDAVRWVRPEGIHLTLKFLGDVDTARIDRIGQALGTALEGRPPMALAIKGLGVFPGVRKARVLWAGLGGDTPGLMALQQTVDAGLETAGFSRETRPFKAHLTLGRFRQRPPARLLVTVLERFSVYPPCELPVERVALYQSELRPQGARYTALRQWALEDLPGGER